MFNLLLGMVLGSMLTICLHEIHSRTKAFVCVYQHTGLVCRTPFALVESLLQSAIMLSGILWFTLKRHWHFLKTFAPRCRVTWQYEGLKQKKNTQKRRDFREKFTRKQKQKVRALVTQYQSAREICREYRRLGKESASLLYKINAALGKKYRTAENDKMIKAFCYSNLKPELVAENILTTLHHETSTYPSHELMLVVASYAQLLKASHIRRKKLMRYMQPGFFKDKKSNESLKNYQRYHAFVDTLNAMDSEAVHG